MLQLPAVQKEVKRRQRQLAREEMWSGLVALFTPIIFLAVWAWNNLCLLPVAALRRFWVDTDNKTPPNSIHQPNDDSFKVINAHFQIPTYDSSMLLPFERSLNFGSLKSIPLQTYFSQSIRKVYYDCVSESSNARGVFD